MPIQKKTFLGPLDSDSTDELLKGDRYRLNVRVLSSENSTIGAIETMNGNSLVTFTLPSGTNTVIGSKEDELRKKVYFFVHNTSFNHLILEYDSVTNAISKVFQDSVNILNGQTNILNFQLTNLITGINIVELDSDNHLLYWTDGYINPNNPNQYNEPRKINIEKGKYFMAGNHTLGYKTPFDPEILFRIKQPSLCGPTYIWAKGLHEIQVTSNITQTYSYPPTTGYVPVQFNVIQFDDSNEFNPTGSAPAYSWTVGETYQYSLATTVQMVLTGASGLITINIYVNGIVMATLSPTVTPAMGYVSYTVHIDTIALNVGDVVYVGVQNGAFGGTLNFTGTSFTSQKKKVNNLFKRYPVFKTQFVYDDNDVSSWSPWSPYVFPSVVHTGGGTTGNDIITQDDTINVIVDTGIGIVTKIRIACKMLGQRLVNNVLENLEFSLIAELNKADLLIGDNSTYSFIFLNDGNYTPIYINESIKLFDSVPLTSQAQEVIIDNRITDGLIREGQDLVSIDMKIGLTFKDIESFPNWGNLMTPASFLKSGGIYKYGIVYSDHAGRLSTTNIQRGQTTVLLPNGKFGTTLYVPFLTESGYAAPHGSPNIDMRYVPQVNMEIYNPPPSWATHYQIVRSQNEAITKYLQFASQGFQYTDDNGTIVAANVATRLNVFILNITGRYLGENGTSTLVYGFTPGDRIRLIANRAAGAGPAYNTIDPFFSFNDTQIISYDSSLGIVYVKMTSDIPQNLITGALFEIYTPARTVLNDNEFVYEIGECYPLSTDIHGNLIHTLSTSNQLIVTSSNLIYAAPNIIATVATGHGLVVTDKVKVVDTTFSVYGVVTVSSANSVTIDTTGYTVTFLPSNIVRTIYKAATGTMHSGDCFRMFQDMPWEAAGSIYRLYSYVENMNISNLWESNAWDYARPNVVDDNAGRVTRQSTCIWSEAFIPETLINGLSTVYDTNFQTYEQKYGGIYLLVNKNLFLDMYQELKVSRIPIQQSVLTGTQGEQIVGKSTDVLERIPSYYQGEFGIGRHPESHGFYAERDYWIDVNRGAVLRKSNDGITVISDLYFMHNYFTDKCAEVLALNQKVNIYGVYDKKFGEYVINFEEIPPIGFTGETLAFNEKYNAFSTFYSFLSNGMCTNGTSFVSFKGGAIYTHNTNSVQGMFYGVQYQPELWVTLNDQPSIVKILEGVGLESNDAWEVYLITTPDGQASNLIVSDFGEMENNQYAGILRDINTPNIANPLFQGDVMRNRTALFKLRYPLTTYNKIFAVNLKFIISNPFIK